MSLLELPCTLVGSRGRASTVCLCDSGASYSVIRRTTAEHEVFLEFFLEDAPRCFTDSFMVPDALSEELIIGAATMQKWGIKLDFVEEKVLYDGRVQRLRL